MYDLSPIWISLKTALVSFAIVLVLACLLAWGVFNLKNWKLRAFIDGLITLPMVLPPTVCGFLLLLLLGNKGIFAPLLSSLHISFAFDWKGTVVASCVVALPLLYRSVLAGFDQVDEYKIQAAKTLGFSSFQIFYRVLLPEARQSIVSGSILSAARGLGEFGATAMLAGNIIGKTRTLPLAVYSAVMSSNYNTAAFYAIILIIISLIAVWGLNFYSARMERRKKNARR
jgi:molybdate transport system permease protein